MNQSALEKNLAELGISAIRFFDSIGSTNDEALTWAAEGSPDCALVVADEQTKGRGRLNRHWITEPDAALAFSLILRPTEMEARSIQLFSALGAVGVQQSLERLYNLPALIKWPNDVLVNEKKLCGILVETVWMGQQIESLVIGIGVNVAPSSVPDPAGLMFPATCVESEAGEEIDRLMLLKKILENIFSWRKQLSCEAFYATYKKHLAFRGRWVKINMPGEIEISGILKGLGKDGSLLLENDLGEEISIAAGDLRLRPN